MKCTSLPSSPKGSSDVQVQGLCENAGRQLPRAREAHCLILDGQSNGSILSFFFSQIAIRVPRLAYTLWNIASHFFALLASRLGFWGMTCCPKDTHTHNYTCMRRQRAQTPTAKVGKNKETGEKMYVTGCIECVQVHARKEFRISWDHPQRGGRHPLSGHRRPGHSFELLDFDVEVSGLGTRPNMTSRRRNCSSVAFVADEKTKIREPTKTILRNGQPTRAHGWWRVQLWALQAHESRRQASYAGATRLAGAEEILKRCNRRCSGRPQAETERCCQTLLSKSRSKARCFLLPEGTVCLGTCVACLGPAEMGKVDSSESQVCVQVNEAKLRSATFQLVLKFNGVLGSSTARAYGGASTAAWSVK